MEKETRLYYFGKWCYEEREKEFWFMGSIPVLRHMIKLSEFCLIALVALVMAICDWKLQQMISD